MKQATIDSLFRLHEQIIETKRLLVKEQEYAMAIVLRDIEYDLQEGMINITVSPDLTDILN